MQFIPTKLSGVLVIEPLVFSDSRGFFLETYQKKIYQAAGIHCEFLQDNLSCSHVGVIRGLHYQLKYPQAKLVSVVRGTLLDVVVDIRKGSPTFGQWISVELSDKNHRQLFIPGGFAHGFSVLSEVVDFSYKCSDYYHPEDEYGVIWNDPVLNINWKVRHTILSTKDQQYLPLEKIPESYLPSFKDPE